MKLFLRALLAVTAAVVFSGGVFAGEKAPVVVLGFGGSGVAEEIRNAAGQFVASGLADSKKFMVMEKGNLEKVLASQGILQNDCLAPECAVKVGRLLDAAYAVTGSVIKAGEMYFVEAKLVSIEEKNVVSSIRVRFGSAEKLADACDKVVLHFGGDEIAGIKKISVNSPAGYILPAVGAACSLSVGILGLLSVIDGAQETGFNKMARDTVTGAIVVAFGVAGVVENIEAIAEMSASKNKKVTLSLNAGRGLGINYCCRF